MEWSRSRHWLLRHDPAPLRLVAALVPRHARAGQQASRGDMAGDPPPRRAAPGKVEREPGGEEGHVGIGQVIVDPPGEPLPVAGRAAPVPEARHDNAGGRAPAALSIILVPDVHRLVTGIAGAVVILGASASHPVAEGIELGRAIGRADHDPAERRLEGLEQLLAQPLAGSDREVRIGGQVGKAVDRGDLGIEEVAHEEMARQPLAAQLGELGHAHRGRARRRSVWRCCWPAHPAVPS